MVIQNFTKAGYPFEYILFSTCSEAATEVFYKESVLKNFAIIFTGKQRWDFERINLVNKRDFLLKRTLFKKTPTQVLSCEYCEIFKGTLMQI